MNYVMAAEWQADKREKFIVNKPVPYAYLYK